jgi:hypothetical protein
LCHGRSGRYCGRFNDENKAVAGRPEGCKRRLGFTER